MVSSDCSLQLGRGKFIVCIKELDGMTYSGFNASTYWIAPDAVLFYQDGLDEGATHSIKITNTANGMDLAINSFTVYGFNSPSAGGSADAPISSSISQATPAPSAASIPPTTKE